MKTTSVFGSLVLLIACHEDHSTTGPDGGNGTVAQTLFVAHGLWAYDATDPGTLVSYDIATGAEKPGTIPAILGPWDMQALADGTVLVNLTPQGETLVVKGTTMLENGRAKPSSAAVRPVHTYLSPSRAGKQYFMAMYDGKDAIQATNAATFIDVNPTSPTYLHKVGEIALGIDHHKGAFSTTQERVAISNIGDCDDMISVYDYSNIGAITRIKTFSAADAGWTAPDPGAGNFDPRFCDQSYTRGLPPAPHGAATSKLSGKVYMNLTSTGEIMAIDIDASPPTFTKIATTGSGAGYTKMHKGGRYVFTLESSPREGDSMNPGVKCQIGQIVVIDSMTDRVVKAVPLLYQGPSCTTSLVGTDEETDEAFHMLETDDGNTLFVTVAGGYQVAAARVRQEIVFDVSDATNPVQKPSVAIGTSTGYHGDALTGDGKLLFIANNLDASVTRIDTVTLATGSIKTNPYPTTLATWGTREGPSEQTGLIVE
jgi:hypothetical protein